MGTSQPKPGYLDAKAERLLVQSLRLSLAGYIYEDCLCWEAVRALTVSEIGPAAGSRLVERVTPTAELLWQLRGSTLRVYPSACRCLSRDECMMIAATASAQHADDEAMDLAIGGLLLKPAPQFSALLATGFRQIGEALDQSGARLLEVPADVVTSILAASPTERLH